MVLERGHNPSGKEVLLTLSPVNFNGNMSVQSDTQQSAKHNLGLKNCFMLVKVSIKCDFSAQGKKNLCLIWVKGCKMSGRYRCGSVTDPKLLSLEVYKIMEFIYRAHQLDNSISSDSSFNFKRQQQCQCLIGSMCHRG